MTVSVDSALRLLIHSMPKSDEMNVLGQPQLSAKAHLVIDRHIGLIYKTDVYQCEQKA
jgi:hypothetical protein